MGRWQQFQATLNQLGFDNYKHYLKSDLWFAIRSLVLSRNPKCQCCAQTTATVVHHRSYDEPVMRGDDLTPLTSLCNTCHHKIEFTRGSKKRTLNEANAILRDLITRRESSPSAIITAHQKRLPGYCQRCGNRLHKHRCRLCAQSVPIAATTTRT